MRRNTKNKHDEQFPLAYLQGGAGTAVHMNVNEVIASMAALLLKNKVHPNDHINCGQSTNDVNPSVLKISLFYLLQNLDNELSSLVGALKTKAKEFKTIRKLGRNTHNSWGGV